MPTNHANMRGPAYFNPSTSTTSYIDLNVIKTFFDIYNSDGTLANGKTPYAELSFNNYFNLKKNWMPYLLLKYNNTGYMREYKIREGLMLGLGVTKSFFNKALYVRLSVNNVFATVSVRTLGLA